MAYAAYLPFEQLLPWSGTWDALDAAHAGAIAWDLLCLALLWRIGRRLGGARLAVMLAYAWAACPFTLYVLNTNGNDGLVAALVLASLAAAASPWASGALVALAGWAKFGPFALAPLFAAHRGARAALRRGASSPSARCAPGLCSPRAALGTFLDRTLGFQAERDAPFSIWGQLATASDGGRRSRSRRRRSCSLSSSRSCRAAVTPPGSPP